MKQITFCHDIISERHWRTLPPLLPRGGLIQLLLDPGEIVAPGGVRGIERGQTQQDVASLSVLLAPLLLVTALPGDVPQFDVRDGEVALPSGIAGVGFGEALPMASAAW